MRSDNECEGVGVTWEYEHESDKMKNEDRSELKEVDYSGLVEMSENDV